MNPEFLSLAPAPARARHRAAVAAARKAQAAEAYRLLTTGVTPEGLPWHRTYDPAPYPEAEPHDTRAYEGTGVGLLYGIEGGERHAWQLAGWNLNARRGE